jgi:hypothetical protein
MQTREIWPNIDMICKIDQIKSNTILFITKKIMI